MESSARLAGRDELTLGEIFEGVHIPQSWLVDFREIADRLPVCRGANGVGSLWTVNDLSTALLMVKVYEGLEREGKSKPEALRDAQLWLRDLMAKEALELVRAEEAELVGV